MTTESELFTHLIVLAGAGQLVLVAVSLAIPRLLNWQAELQKVPALLRRLFWTYAVYILATNLAFGLISACAPDALVDGSVLATAVTGFMAVYWGGRLLVQFALFHRHAPAGIWFRLGEAALVLLFVFLTGVYGTAVAANLRILP